jgi:16S rRNA (cytosine967-C5)-methyltransferase
MDPVMTSQKPRLHKPRNSLRSGVKPNPPGKVGQSGGSECGVSICARDRSPGLVAGLEKPGDAQLSAFFRNYPNFGARERSFIAEAVYGVLRRLRSLQVLAAPPTPRRLLLAWLARHGGRNLREFEALAEQSQLDKADLEWLRGLKGAKLEDQSEAVRLDLPDWLYERLECAVRRAFADPDGQPEQRRAAGFAGESAEGERDEVLVQLNREGVVCAATPLSPLGMRLQGKPALQKHPLFLDGSVEVQDEGSQLARPDAGAEARRDGVRFLRRRRRQDLAAGRADARQRPSVRLRYLGKTPRQDEAAFGALRLQNVQALLIAHERDAKVKRLAGKFDRVLVDAPCSGLGTLRRNPDLKWRQTPESVAELTQIQTNILESAGRAGESRRSPGLCHLQPAGGGKRRHRRRLPRGASRVPSAAGRRVLAAQHIDLKMGDYLRLDTAKHGTDGFFAAVMERTA